jgi:hypothetical protein
MVLHVAVTTQKSELLFRELHILYQGKIDLTCSGLNKVTHLHIHGKWKFKANEPFNLVINILSQPFFLFPCRCQTVNDVSYKYFIQDNMLCDSK